MEVNYSTMVVSTNLPNSEDTKPTEDTAAPDSVISSSKSSDNSDGNGTETEASSSDNIDKRAISTLRRNSRVKSHSSDSSTLTEIDPSTGEVMYSTAIVIKNIPFSIERDELMAQIESLDMVKPYALNYHKDAKGIFRGLAFANFETVEDTKNALSVLNSLELKGRRIKAEPKKKAENQNGLGSSSSFASSTSIATTNNNEDSSSIQEEGLLLGPSVTNNSSPLVLNNNHGGMLQGQRSRTPLHASIGRRISSSPSPVPPSADVLAIRGDTNIRMKIARALELLCDPDLGIIQEITFVPLLSGGEREAIVHEADRYGLQMNKNSYSSIVVSRPLPAPGMVPPRQQRRSIFGTLGGELSGSASPIISKVQRRFSHARSHSDGSSLGGAISPLSPTTHNRPKLVSPFTLSSPSLPALSNAVGSEINNVVPLPSTPVRASSVAPLISESYERGWFAGTTGTISENPATTVAEDHEKSNKAKHHPDLILEKDILQSSEKLSKFLDFLN